MINDTNHLFQKNTDGRFKEGRDSRSAIELLKAGYAVSADEEYAELMAKATQRASDTEALRLQRIESGKANLLELLSEGLNRATEETRLRKEAKLARVAKAQAEAEQLRQDRLNAQHDNGLNG